MAQASALRILIVDDERAHVEAIRRSLLDAGTASTVCVAESLQEYHQAVAACQPSLVLLDYVLPDGRADSVLVTPAESGPFPILLMTSHGDEQLAVAAIRQGALDYIVKSPQAFAEMPHAVERALRSWRLLIERQASLQAVRDSEERLRLTLEAVRMGTFETDLVNNRTVWSRRHEEIWGLKPGEFEGTTEAFLRQVHPEDRELIKLEWERSVANRSPFRKEYRVIWPDGSLHWVEAAGEFTFDEKGSPVRLRGTVFETTQRRQSEQFHALSAEIFALLNARSHTAQIAQRILDAIKRESGFDVVALRLKDGDDSPFRTCASPTWHGPEFPKDKAPITCPDAPGTTQPDCLCRHVLDGNVSLEQNWFTPAGSAWTNDASALPESHSATAGANQCLSKGFRSVALIPIRVKEEIIGLLQLLDRRQGCFSAQAIQFYEGIAASFGVALQRLNEENELRESEDRYRSLFEESPNAIGIYQDSKLVLTNLATVRLFRAQTKAEVIGRRSEELIHPEDYTASRERVRRRLAGDPSVYPAELRYVRLDGSEVYVEVSAAPVQLAGKPAIQFIARDISDRKRAEAELRLLSRVVQQSPASIVMTDPAGVITYVNERFTEVSGFTPEEALGQNPRVLKSGDMPPSVYRNLWQTIAAGRDWHGELHNRKRSGEFYWEQVSISPITDLAGRITHFVAIKEDITERKRLESFREALLKLAHELNGTRNALAAGRALLRAADQLWQWDAAVLNLLNEQGDQQPTLNVDTIAGHRQELDLSGPGSLTPHMRRVLREGAFLILRDPTQPLVTDSVPFGDKNRLSLSIMCVPVRRDSEIVGVLSVQSYAPKAYQQRDLETLQALADYCGGALERIRFEEALGQSEERYRQLVETTFDWIWEVDAEARYTYASPKVLDLLGYSPAEVLGKTPFDLMPEIEAQRVRVVFREIAAKREPIFALENINRHKQGRLVVLETSAVPVLGPTGQWLGYRGMDRDVTERKQAETALRASEERFRMLVESAPIGIFVQVDGRFAYVNQAALHMFRAAHSKNLLGQPVINLVHPESRENVLAHMRLLNEERRAVELKEEKLLHSDGANLHVEFAGVPFLFDGQVGSLFFFYEVTKRKRLEEQLRQAQKLEAIGQLAGGVAHDFNNILAAIMMHLGLLQMDKNLDPATRGSLKELEAEARRAASLTRQLLMFSRRSVLSVKPVDLNEIIANLLKMLGRLIGEHVDLRFDGKTGLPGVEADVGMLEQVLMNLVVNARDAMPRGGRITISTGLSQLTPADVLTNADRRTGSFVCLAVADTGTGMDETTMKKIFEPFFTTKEAGKGTGLGLATAHGIVAQHKGWMEVESAEGHGTTFRVFLPALSAAPVSENREAQNAPLQGGRETILMVEDEIRVRKMVSQTLRSLGYRVYEASNGKEAMALWQTHGDEVDLLFTDMVMPEGMTGLELVENLQSLKPSLRAVISSGYSSEIVQAGVPKRAGLVYLPKPFETKTLAEVVRTCLAKQT